MCDEAKNKNNGEEAEDNVHVDEAEPTPVSNPFDAITAFERVRKIIYAHEIIEKDQKDVVNFENLPFNLKVNADPA
ncbi:hypothetical protein NPIL_678701 [Nephila pilipes]|uniref:Uncharacterized protein n=1 Tax=Nephila pilipes TaxID=299642 RepID=A0A8X6UXF5_NEPPI|nr:hypothetical protein NPIL_678701 [Nephila pilipes]